MELIIVAVISVIIGIIMGILIMYSRQQMLQTRIEVSESLMKAAKENYQEALKAQQERFNETMA